MHTLLAPAVNQFCVQTPATCSHNTVKRGKKSLCSQHHNASLCHKKQLRLLIQSSTQQQDLSLPNSVFPWCNNCALSLNCPDRNLSLPSSATALRLQRSIANCFVLQPSMAYFKCPNDSILLYRGIVQWSGQYLYQSSKACQCAIMCHLLQMTYMPYATTRTLLYIMQ